MITKAELDAAIARLATKAEMKAAIAEATAPLATKTELAEAIAPLATKVEMKDALDTMLGAILAKFDDFGRELRAEMRATAVGLRAEIHASAAQLRTELQQDIALAANSNAEALRAEIRVIDDKYKDLPERVAKLEARNGRRRRP